MFVVASKEYVIGDKGGVDCPSGYHLVTTPEECEKAANANGDVFQGEGGYKFEAIGCILIDSKYYFNSREYASTEDAYAPICGKCRCYIPLYIMCNIFFSTKG